MSGDVFAVIREELLHIHHTIKDQLSIKAGHVGRYAHLEFSPLDSFIRPALVLAVARLYNCRDTKVLSLGAIVQFIFMASHIHKCIPESTQTPAVDPRDGNQFPVLVGDYLYGKFFTTLCKADILEYLSPLAEMIGHIHEGGILSQQLPHNSEETSQLTEEVMRLEVAELFGGASRLAGELSGAPEADQKNLYQLGICVGMIYGFNQRKNYHKQSQPYVEQATALLERLPDSPERNLLENLVRTVQLRGMDIRKVV